jgi:inosine-uridine nucleoside N-ribohydrolase
MRGDVTARLLKAAGRNDIPIAAGRTYRIENIANHLKHYLEKTETPKGNYSDAARAIVDTIHASPEPVTIICIAPLTNIGDAVKLDPSIAPKTNIVAMSGSVYKNYKMEQQRCKEWNVFCDNESSETVYNNQKWRSMSIIPLDTSTDLFFSREWMKDLESLNDPLLNECLVSHLWWESSIRSGIPGGVDYPAPDYPEKTSSLYDVAAVYLAYSNAAFVMEEKPMIVKDGIFVDSEDAPNRILAAVDWKDRAGFEKHFTERLKSNI